MDACPYTIAISKANVQIRIVLQFQQSRSLHLGYTCYIYRVKSPSFTPWFKCKKKQSFQTDFSQEMLHYMSLLFLKTSKLIASSTLSIVICPPYAVNLDFLPISHPFISHTTYRNLLSCLAVQLCMEYTLIKNAFTGGKYIHYLGKKNFTSTEFRLEKEQRTRPKYCF